MVEEGPVAAEEGGESEATKDEDDEDDDDDDGDWFGEFSFEEEGETGGLL